MQTPYFGLNPPYNGGSSFDPPFNISNPSPPPVSLIVKQDSGNLWRDDNGTDWTRWVSGADAAESGRTPGWQLLDNDVAVIDINTLGVSYIENMMNICMDISVNPSTGAISVIGTDATNEIRFEPKLKGTFIRVNIAFADPTTLETTSVVDLNKNHLNGYSQPTIPYSERKKSIGDPRGMVWNTSGTRAYITGMGSNNLIIIDADGERIGDGDAIPLREGPVGIVLDENRNKIYVHNRFDSSVSILDLTTTEEIGNVSFFDPTPQVVKAGRKHLYGTHDNSGLGQLSCASCHVDAQIDRLAWDLGDPSGETIFILDRIINMGDDPSGYTDFHPMKGPMTTQTLQDIIGHEPLHWRGDRSGIEEFNGAFIGLQGNDKNLTSGEMSDFKSFLASIYFPPNPFRNIDNSLPDFVDLTDYITVPNNETAYGNASSGLNSFLGLTANFSCSTCHTLPTGLGSNSSWINDAWVPVPPGINGERHLMMMSTDGFSQKTFKIPQLRSIYRKTGMFLSAAKSVSGFGYMHDGRNTLTEFASNNEGNQEGLDILALLLSWSGSGFGVENTGANFELPPGVQSRDVHAAVGNQVTIISPDDNTDLLNTFMYIVDNPMFDDTPSIELVAKGMRNDIMRGWYYLGSGLFQQDEAGVIQNVSDILEFVGEGTETTFTILPVGTGIRVGIDRDLDGYYDFDEFVACSSSTDFDVTPLNSICLGEGEGEGEGSACVNLIPNAAIHSADVDADSTISLTELLRVIQLFNLLEFHCDCLSPDRFAPGPGDRTCVPHTSDFITQNWSISLGELLRMIQYFNIGGYTYCQGVGEDNFCPGTV